ncbi:hypothetical protein [Catenulispora subtropica]|uniref:DUF5666 domain-containing protein n=1 Tax=Catenulispora subtropica TaxID=450798 RepID=A0ABN2QV73_9ACTN
MKLTKKSGGVVAAVVMAGGLTAASATSAFADAPAHSSKSVPAAKTHKGLHHRLGMHGERTVKGKDGKTVVHEWQAGVVTAVSGDTVTVKSTDGFTLTWTLDSTTKVHAGTQGAKAKVGDKVLVEGVKSGSANQARVLIDRTDKHAKKAPGGKHRKPTAPHGHDRKTSAHDA